MMTGKEPFNFLELPRDIDHRKEQISGMVEMAKNAKRLDVVAAMRSSGREVGLQTVHRKKETLSRS